MFTGFLISSLLLEWLWFLDLDFELPRLLGKGDLEDLLADLVGL